MADDRWKAPEIQSESEKKHIKKRTISAGFQSLLFYICRIFSIKEKLISVCTFEGKGGFGCNPKYLVQELHRRNPDYDFVWFVNDMGKSFPDYIRKVPNTIWSRAYWLSRSKIWIDNYRKPYGTKKRKNQYYLNVNHFTLGIKCTGLLRGDGLSKMAYLVNKSDSDMIDGLVIDSKWCEECFDKAMLYDGVMLKTGAPRCDVLYGDRGGQRKKLRIRHALAENAKIVMFAPTFREGADNGKRFVYSEIWSIDFKRLLNNLEKKFTGKWHICIRVHPQLANLFTGYHEENDAVSRKIFDESGYDDFYELLAGVDAYITDYSSAIFEAGYAHIPSFIYADDIEEYGKARGNLYWNLANDDREAITNNKDTHPDMELTLPFTVARNNDQLEEDILKFNKDEYDMKLDRFHEAIGLVFDGKASSRLAEHISDIIENSP
ncbi:MAG: CDP-glycerol glycerophosphotransferase family protein [Lachnospiraceae bacterium]|nr:CDP-glycerol glycerophosphotransferase family protein [Lachnospiraceae bacterium]